MEIGNSINQSLPRLVLDFIDFSAFESVTKSTDKSIRNLAIDLLWLEINKSTILYSSMIISIFVKLNTYPNGDW